MKLHVRFESQDLPPIDLQPIGVGEDGSVTQIKNGKESFIVFGIGEKIGGFVALVDSKESIEMGVLRGISIDKNADVEMLAIKLKEGDSYEYDFTHRSGRPVKLVATVK